MIWNQNSTNNKKVAIEARILKICHDAKFVINFIQFFAISKFVFQILEFEQKRKYFTTIDF